MQSRNSLGSRGSFGSHPNLSRLSLHGSTTRLGSTTKLYQDTLLGHSMICVLKGYPTIYSLLEIKEMAASQREHELPRERRLACCVMITAIFFLFVLSLVYCDLIFLEGYDLQADVILVVETTVMLNALMLGMCMFRWCSLNDIAPITVWQRVAVTQPSPLRLLEWDLETGNITFFEYSIDYGEYPHRLHEPVVLEQERNIICNARDLVKITKKDPDPDEAFSYGAIYFHYKGDDEYLLERWKYQFEKYHNPVEKVYKKCNKLHSTLGKHFGWNTKVKILDYQGTKPVPMPKGSIRLKAMPSDDGALDDMMLDDIADRTSDILKKDKRTRAFSAESMSLKQGDTYSGTIGTLGHEPTPMIPMKGIFDTIKEERSGIDLDGSVNTSLDRMGMRTTIGMEDGIVHTINIAGAGQGTEAENEYYMSTHDYESEGSSNDNVPDIRDIDPELILISPPSRKNTSAARTPGSKSPRTANRPEEVYAVVAAMDKTLVTIQDKKRKNTSGGRPRMRTESGPPPGTSIIPRFQSEDLHDTLRTMGTLNSQMELDEDWLHSGLHENLGSNHSKDDDDRDPSIDHSHTDHAVLAAHVPDVDEHEEEQSQQTPDPAPIALEDVRSPFEPAHRGIDAYYHHDDEYSDHHNVDQEGSADTNDTATTPEPSNTP